MRRFLVIEDEIIVAIIEKPNGSWKLTDYEGAYDTIQEDPEGHFKKGDIFTIDKMLEFYPPDQPVI